MSTQGRFDLCRGAVAESYPDDLRRGAVHEAALVEIGVLRNDQEAVSHGICPDGVIVGAGQPDVTHMGGVGEDLGQRLYETRRQILVEEELHTGGTDASLRSRSAANARHARMSSAVRSGKSARIWASVMPEAK